MILLRILKNNRAGGAAFVMLLLVLQWVPSFIDPLPAVEWVAMPFYKLLFSPLHSLPILSGLVSMIFIAVMAVMLVRLNVKYFLIEERSFMPGAMFILIAGSFPAMHQVSPVLIGSFFLLVSIVILFNAHDDEPDSLRIFNASLVLGLGSMFYLNLVWFIPLIWIALLIIRPMRWRELIYPIVVFMMIGLFLVTYYWVILDDLSKLSELLAGNLAFPHAYAGYELKWLIFIGYMLLLLIIAGIYAMQKIQVRKIVIRKLYQVFFAILVFALVFDLLIVKLVPELFSVIAIPVSYLLANFFHRRRNHWMHELLIWIWIGLIVYLQIW